MRSYILLGDLETKNEFLESFIVKNRIPSYNIFRFEGKIGIPEIREIKKSLNISSGETRRIYIFLNELTSEAQNALLKTLEELDDVTDFMFAGNSELLTTITSRSNVVRTSDARLQTSELSTQDGELVRKMIDSSNSSDIMIAIDGFFSEKRGNQVDTLVLALRSIMIDEILNKNFAEVKKINKILSELTKKNILVLSNNLNVRLVVERVFLK